MFNTISAADANRHFSEILGRAADGETVTITRRGAPVAQLVPYQGSEKMGDEGQAWGRLFTMLKRGVKGEAKAGTVDIAENPPRFDRDALYDDRCGGR